MKRYRIQYAKNNPVRFTSNLDIHKIWERWLRRAALPISYSLGFHPQPKINQAAPLPLGMLSVFELVDIWLDEDLNPKDILQRLLKTQQPGMPISRIEEVEFSLPAMQASLLSSTYQIHLLEAITTQILEGKVTGMLAEEQILRERRGKPYNLRPLILDLQVQQETNNKAMLLAELCMQPGATGRPDELVEALGISQEDVLIERVALKFPV